MTDQLPTPPPHPHEPEATADASPAGDAAPTSVLRNAFWCLLAAAGASFFYALKMESSLFRAIGLQLLLCGVAVWSAINAEKIRRRLQVTATAEVLAVKREVSSLHYLFVAAPLALILVLTGLSMVAQMVEVAVPRSQQHVIGGAILAVLVASLWTVFARLLPLSNDALSTDAEGQSAEYREVRRALLESRLAALVSAATLMAATVVPPMESWLAWGLSVWVIAVTCEHLCRLFVAWFRPTTPDATFTGPVESLLREIFLSTLNPVAKAFDIAEARFGLSLRSSWTIRFFRRSVMPIAVGCLLIVWLSTCFVVVEPHQAGLEERFGIAQRERLSPGLHIKLPWPVGEIRRYPAGLVQTMQIGFEEEDPGDSVSMDLNRTLLWTQPHAREFSLVLGSETELVAVNAIVYFKIAEDTQGFLDHALAVSNPEVALQALAYRVLMEQTRSATLADLLSQGRDQFARTVAATLQNYATTEKLGLDIVDVSLINLHPPVEVAGSYLDVINAELDSRRLVTEAGGESAERILQAEQDSHGSLATARVAAARRVSVAGQESAEFAAVGRAYASAPETYRLRLWFEAFERVLAGRRLFILDSDLPQVILDERPGTARVPIESSQPEVK